MNTENNQSYFKETSRDGVKIKIYNSSSYEGMRKAGRLAAQVLDYITPYVKSGISTGEIDRLCHDFIISHNAIPAPLNYKGFPKSVCTSVNHVICHGIPSDAKILVEGDIINIDVTVILDGWYGDTSRMFKIGKVSKLAERLVDVTYESMMRGIECVRPGVRLGDVGQAIQSFVEAQKFSVVRDFCGHGIGRVFHDHPEVLHFGKSGHGIELVEGMFFTVEPMVNTGRPDVKILQDGWTAVTKDKSLSAQFEHTIGVTSNGYEIFTVSA
ncbi:MAG: type I methionyl aminopeptidase [Caedimonadaceae bacterium]|nr:MAG: type I methionyl aminopeptidase [Caedimonadaceae bacterium]